MALDALPGAAEGGGMEHPVHCSMGRRARQYAVVAGVAVAAALSGCQGAQVHQQAQAALARWADAVAAAGGHQGVVLVGELTAQVGDWEPAVGDNNKRALYAGLVEAAVSLPAETPAEGEVRWQGGATRTVRVISAQQAVTEIRASATASCPECAALRITGARLTTGSVETSRGPATAPIWEFTVQGTSVKVTRVAIADPITVVLAPWNSNDPAVGISVDSASGTVGGREIAVAFVGAPLPGNQACGEDYTAEAVESPLAVVVIVTAHPHGLFEACTAVGARRSATVELAAPLGERAVLEVQQGLPVPVLLTP
jgi:hypothetical protein